MSTCRYVSIRDQGDSLLFDQGLFFRQLEIIPLIHSTILSRFHSEPLGLAETTGCSCVPGHITKMSLKFSITSQTRVLSVFSKKALGLTLTLTPRSGLLFDDFVWENI